MRFKFSDPKAFALTSALLIGLFSIIVSSILLLTHLNNVFFEILGIGVLVFLFSYFFLYKVVESFIYDKIKIIYKTIHSLKRPKDGDKSKLVISSDTLEMVNRQVLEWGESKAREIEELQNLAKYRKEYIGNVSHELKTPIFNMQGYVLTLLDGGLEDPTINKEYLLRTEKSINRMIAIVEDLEAISQLESGELKLNNSKFDIISLARDVIEFLEIKSQRKNIEITIAGILDKPIFVRADKERIRQVFINLIENSIKYNFRQSDANTQISFFDMDENILVEIADNGVGIAQQDLGRIFERFYRTDKGRSREQGGTGLGLAIVKHIIEAHEQTISVRSWPGIGTTFGFTLKKG
ncbi:MAG: sensor histidine kinase [Bacteroidetes bacterium]|nr:sensor histidine kinase [Bacteroidota bacterium]